MSAGHSKVISIPQNPLRYLGKIVSLYPCADGSPLKIEVASDEAKEKSAALWALNLFFTLSEQKSSLMSTEDDELSQIYKWVASESFALEAINNGMFGISTRTVDKPLSDDDFYPKLIQSTLSALNFRLKLHTYLAAERITLADVSVFCQLIPLYSILLSAEARKEYVYMDRWFDLMIHQPKIASVLGNDFKYCEESKFSFLLECIPPSTFNFLEWKTIYSSKDPSESVKWLWDNYDPVNFSMYKMVYNYPEDLTQLFMSKNLIIGFYQRIEAASLHGFGTVLVLGVENNNHIRGYFIFRGQDLPRPVLEAPDFASFTFTKVDTSDPNVRKDAFDYLAWSSTVEGLPFADGKVFQ